MIQSLLKIAYETGQLIHSFVEWWFEVEQKTHEHDLVTSADKAAEEFLRKELLSLLPWSKFLGEESCEPVTDWSGDIWIVDPIDGTKNFVGGSEKFGTIIWLCRDWIPVLGVVYYPVVWKIIYAQTWKWAVLLDASWSQTIDLSDWFEWDFKAASRQSYWSIAWLVGQICQWNASWAYRDHGRRYKWDLCGLQVVLQEAWWHVFDSEWNPLDFSQENLNFSNWIILWTHWFCEKYLQLH